MPDLRVVVTDYIEDDLDWEVEQMAERCVQFEHAQLKLTFAKFYRFSFWLDRRPAAARASCRAVSTPTRGKSISPR